MRKKLLGILVCSVVVAAMTVTASAADGVSVSSANFPDAGFREYVSDTFDVNRDNVLSKEEIAEANEISIDPENGYSATDLTGIGYLTELKSIYVDGIKKADFSKNTKLESIDLGWGSFTSLDLRKNKNLKKVDVQYGQLKSINLNGLTKLNWLKLAGDQLTTLDISNTGLMRSGDSFAVVGHQFRKSDTKELTINVTMTHKQKVQFDKFCQKLQAEQALEEDADDEQTYVVVKVTPYKVVPAKTAYVFSGKYIKPSAKVYDGPDLLGSGDYTLSYSSCKNVGTATVTAAMKNGLTGSQKATYRINPKTTAIKSLKASKKAFTVKWKKQSAKMAKSRITGYQIRYSTSSKMTKAKTKKVKGYSKTSKKISKLKAKKRYYVQVRTYKVVSGKTYYGAWSAKKKIKTR